MLTFEARARIAAPAAHVWAALLDVAAWPSWDASLDRVEGTLEPGSQVTLHLERGGRPFRLRVVEVEPPARLVLRGGMPLGLFTGTRRYRLEQTAEEQTDFAMVETYTGPLAPLITRSIPDLQPSFEAFTSGLRAAAEA